MTRAGVLVANTPNAVPRPVATIALTFVLALAHRLMAKDRITRAGRWPERLEHMGTGLTGRTLGVIGAGRIGKELLRMAQDLRSEAARRRPLRRAPGARVHRRAPGCAGRADGASRISWS